MTKPAAILALVPILWSTSGAAFGQNQLHYHSKLDSTKAATFIAEITEATARFVDRNEAIAAGYRLIGPDFPGMGEHWVHPREILRKKVDARRPSVLSYVVLNGKPVLTGAAFALPIAMGETPPDLPFGDVWHVHEGSVDEETLVLNSGVKLRGTKSDYQLAMFHVWTWLENPDGVFSQDNWTLPFVRLGLPVPDKVTPAAGKAIFLSGGGDKYYLRLLEIAAQPTEEEMRRFGDILSDSARDVNAIVESSDGPPNVAQLEKEWFKLWAKLKDAASDQVWKKLAELAE